MLNIFKHGSTARLIASLCTIPVWAYLRFFADANNPRAMDIFLVLGLIAIYRSWMAWVHLKRSNGIRLVDTPEA